MDLKNVVKDFHPRRSERIVDSAPDIESRLNIINKGISDIQDIIKAERSYVPEKAPTSVEECDLEDYQICEVRSYLMDINEKYFKDYPLTNDLNQVFIWDIQQCVYKTHEHCKAHMYPDVLDPLFWLYMFCVDLDPEKACEIINRSINLFKSNPEVDSIITDILKSETDEEEENNYE